MTWERVPWKSWGASGLGAVSFSTRKKPLAVKISLSCSLQLVSLIAVTLTTCRKWAEEVSILLERRATVEVNRLILRTLAAGGRGTVMVPLRVPVMVVES